MGVGGVVGVVAVFAAGLAAGDERAPEFALLGLLLAALEFEVAEADLETGVDFDAEADLETAAAAAFGVDPVNLEDACPPPLPLVALATLFLLAVAFFPPPLAFEDEGSISTPAFPGSSGFPLAPP